MLDYYIHINDINDRKKSMIKKKLKQKKKENRSNFINCKETSNLVLKEKKRKKKGKKLLQITRNVSF